MENKKSSIDWLFIRLFELFDQYERGKISRWTLGELMVTKTEQAKAMHKKEIIDTWYNCKMSVIEKNPTTADQYYEQTFGGQDNE